MGQASARSMCIIRALVAIAPIGWMGHLTYDFFVVAGASFLGDVRLCSNWMETLV